MDLSEMSENPNRHPWELSRCSRLLSEIKKLPEVGTVLDIGCGDGYFDRRLLAEDRRVEFLCGLDVFLESGYRDGKSVFVNRFEDVPQKKYDLILMMDVLEHIEDDSGYLAGLHRLLAPGGVILVTVPAFMKLYSLHDKELKHFRRYDRRMLGKAVSAAGFEVVDQSYFYLSLIFLRLLTMKKTENLSMWSSPEKSIKTRLVTGVLNADYTVLRFFSRLGIYFGGLSLLAVLKETGKNETE